MQFILMQIIFAATSFPCYENAVAAQEPKQNKQINDKHKKRIIWVTLF